jgi:hypothetical protein
VLGALPGIREIRSALAGGYLWIVVLWLALDPGLGESDFDIEPYRSAHHLGDEVGPVALGVAITFAAYLIGTFFNEARGVLARLYLRARQSASTGPEAVAGSEEATQRRRRRRREALSGALPERRPHLPSKRRDARPRRSDQALANWINQLILEMALFGAQLGGAAVTASSVFAEAAFELNEAIQRGVNSFVRRLISIRIEPYRPFVSEHGVKAIERYLRQQVPQGQLAVADVIADFPIIRTRLIHRSPDTVSEHDRLRAEADFRSAIFFPLLGIIAILVIKVSWLWAAATLPLLILISTARAKRREAGDILADLLGVVEAPCVEAAGTAGRPPTPFGSAASPSG